MAKRLFSFVLVLLMLVSCFVACGKDDEKEESKAPAQNNSDEVAFESLTDNREKLVYLSGGVDDYVNYDDKIYGVLGVEDEDIVIPTIAEDAVVKMALQAQLTELSVGGEDILEKQFGGPMGVAFNALTDGLRLNMDAAVNIAGMNIDLDVKAGENGVLVTSPFVFQNPLYVSGEYLNGLAAGFSNYSAIIESVGSLSADLANLAEDATFAAYLRTKAVELIPEDAVEATKATISGDYINGDAETDCIVLTMNGDELSVLISSLRQSLENDATFKALSAGLIKSISGLVAAGIIAAEGDGATLTDTELYDALFDFTDDLAEELKGNTDLTIIFKRYFLNGVDSRWDIEISEKENTGYISFWDIYVDNANDYGFVFKIDGEEMLSLKGGSAGDSADVSFKLNENDTDYEMNDDGMYEEADVIATVMSFSMKRNGKDYELDLNLMDRLKVDYEQTNGHFDAILYIEEQTVEADGTIIEKDNGVTVNARIELGDNDLEITFDRTNEITETKISQENEIKVKVEVDGTITVATLELNAVIDTDSGETIIDPVPDDDAFVVDGEDDLENIFSNFTETFIGLISSSM